MPEACLLEHASLFIFPSALCAVTLLTCGRLKAGRESGQTANVVSPGRDGPRKSLLDIGSIVPGMAGICFRDFQNSRIPGLIHNLFTS
jgi:hypothetical protein